MSNEGRRSRKMCRLSNPSWLSKLSNVNKLSRKLSWISYLSRKRIIYEKYKHSVMLGKQNKHISKLSTSMIMLSKINS